MTATIEETVNDPQDSALNATSTTIVLGSAPAVDEIVVIVAYFDENAGTITPPSNLTFTQIASLGNGDSALTHWSGWAVGDGVEDTFTLGWANAQSCWCTTVVLGAVDVADPINASATNPITSFVTGHTSPTVTTDADDCLILRAMGLHSLASLAFADSPELVNYDSGASSAAADISGAIATETAASAGAVGTESVVSSTGRKSIGVTIAFNPADAGQTITLPVVDTTPTPVAPTLSLAGQDITLPVFDSTPAPVAPELSVIGAIGLPTVDATPQSGSVIVGVQDPQSPTQPASVTVPASQWLDMSDGIGQRTDRFRFDVLSPVLDTVGELTVRSDSGSIENNIHSQIKRIMDLSLPPGALDDIDLFSARIRPMLILPDHTEYPLGVFLFADTSRVRGSWGEAHEPTLVDQGLIVDQPVSSSISVASGASVRDAIVDLLTDVGIVNYQIDVDASVGAPLGWAPGTSRQTAINELARIAGGYSLFFDNAGVARVIAAPDTDTPTLFYETANPRIGRDTIVLSDDSLDAPNRFVVVSTTGIDDNPIVGVYDIPDSAPHSAFNRGFVVAAVQTTEGLASVGAAKARAKAWAKQQSSNYEWMSYDSPLDPRHDTFDVIEVDYGDGPEVWREQGWTMELVSGGVMAHDLRRSYTT